MRPVFLVKCLRLRSSKGGTGDFSLAPGKENKQKMNNENFAGIMGTVKQAEVTNGVCGYDTENLYVVLRVCVPRKSGAEDTVIVAAKIKENENIDAEAIARNMVVGRDIMATGILQKAINAESGHTAVFILAEQVATVAFPEYQNGVQLTAEIVNNPEVRETPRGKHIADVMLKVENCIQGGNVHIPCIFWQENASEIAKYKRGTIVKITGRLQSREYVKKYYGDNNTESEEKRTTFEVSVEKMQVWWQPETVERN